MRALPDLSKTNLKYRSLQLAVLFSCVYSGSLEIQAQQEWGYSQYFFNLYDINSAYAGNHGNPSIALRVRKQWPGISGSPSSQSFSLHKPLGKHPIGVGMKVFHESIGARNHWGFKLNAAYKLALEKGTLSAGISAGLIHEALDLNQLNIRDSDDLVGDLSSWQSTVPNLDVSIFYNTTRFWLGAECSRVNRSKFNWADESLARLYYQISATSGIIYQIGKDDLFQISGLVRMSEGQIWQSEGNVAILWNDLFWLGSGYRFPYGPVFFAEWNISTQLRLGYSYDIGLGPRTIAMGPGHELFLGFNIEGDQKKSIRFFN